MVFEHDVLALQYQNLDEANNEDGFENLRHVSGKPVEYVIET
eukprot:gene24767-30163_t